MRAEVVVWRAPVHGVHAFPLPAGARGTYAGRQRGQGLVIARLTDSIARGVENAVASVSSSMFEPVIRVGVTGLARSGKTVFITSLVANLLDRGRMPQLAAAAQGRIEAVVLQPQPDMTVPRFDVEGHLASLTGDDPRWPVSTRSISELRLSFRVRPTGFLSSFSGPRMVHVDIVDYPGEWLIDLGLMALDYGQWCEKVLARIAKRPEASGYLALARAEDGSLPHDEARARALAETYTAYLAAAREAGRSDGAPGRFLLPGDLAGSPVLCFAPLPMPATTGRGSLWREMRRRFDGYKRQVVEPFFRTHFARIDRQIVLVDVLGAIHRGPVAVQEARAAMAEVLTAFRPGANGWLSRLLGTHRVERILFAATKADHLHHGQHPRLTGILQAMLREAISRADFSGARTMAMSMAALRCTVEEDITRDGVILSAVRGRLLSTGRQAALYPGELPEDPARLLAAARDGAARWLDADYTVMDFAPARLRLRPGEGPPHIRLDRAAQFLIGDRL